MILSFINNRKVPREGGKPRATPSVFNTSFGTLRMLMNGKTCLIPLFNYYYAKVRFEGLNYMDVSASLAAYS